MRRKHAERLVRLEEQATRIEDALARIWGAVDLKSPGGLAAVMSATQDAAADAKAAREHAEYANAGMQALASQATVKPGIPEVVKAVSAQADALRAMEQSVRAATGPQPVLKDPPAASAAPSGMGSRTPAGKPRGGKPA